MGFRWVSVALVLAFAFLALVFPVSAAGNLPVQSEHYDRKSAAYEITALYPRTGNAAIDKQVADWIKAQADWFIKNAAADHASDYAYTLDISFTVTRNDSKMFETLFEVEMATGGAHPNHELHTLNFFVPDGARVYLSELITYEGMARVSELAAGNLIKEIAGDGGITSEDQIRDGTKPHPGNFELFTLNKDTLTLYFNEYQVAAYAAGPQKTDIPLSKLRGVMRDDPRAPQPSFDCAKAATPVEHSICSDAGLARADRKVAEGHYYAVGLAENDADKTRARAAQRAFIAKRDACASQIDAALTQCIRGAYAARVKDFNTEPD